MVPVELLDPNVARIYSKTNRAKVNMPTIPSSQSYGQLGDSAFCNFHRLEVPE